MKKVIILSLAVLAFACGNRRNGRVQEAVQTVAEAVEGTNSRNSLQYAGLYEGVVPCADCPGIEISLSIDYDGNYTKKMTYQGRGGGDVSDTHGKYEWNAAGNTIKLLGPEDESARYMVFENCLVMLDTEGKRITGELADKYILKKKLI